MSARERIQFGDSVKAEIVPGPLSLREKAAIAGRYECELFRSLAKLPDPSRIDPRNIVMLAPRADGVEKPYVKVDQWADHNIMTDQGLTYLLDCGLSGATQITAWKVVLSESDTSAAAGMTYATPTFTEVNADVDEAARVAWTEGGVSSKVITNSANKASFTFNASSTIYAAGLVGGGTGAATKANTDGGGTLLSYSKFTASKAVVDDDVLKVTVTITGSNVA